jgi:hypothetical protein
MFLAFKIKEDLEFATNWGIFKEAPLHAHLVGLSAQIQTSTPCEHSSSEMHALWSADFLLISVAFHRIGNDWMFCIEDVIITVSIPLKLTK